MFRYALLAVPFALASPAHAGTQDDVNTCQEAIQSQLSGADVTFESIKGSSVKRITFTVSLDDKSTKVVCKIKRGRVISID